jgi:hypothetical protein
MRKTPQTGLNTGGLMGFESRCQEATMEITQCPDPTCDGPAEILNRFVLPSTEGGVDFVRLVCIHRHWFMMPLSSLKPSVVDWGAS